jgi:hypothetical protein
LLRINLGYGHHIDDAQLEKLVRFCPNLHKLIIYSPKISYKGLEFVSELSSLRKLKLFYTTLITDKGLEFSKYSSLRKLDLPYCNKLIKTDMMFSCSLQQLELTSNRMDSSLQQLEFTPFDRMESNESLQLSLSKYHLYKFIKDIGINSCLSSSVING